MQMLASAERASLHRSCAVVVSDLGLTPADRERLARRFPWCRVETFDFSSYPPHVRDLGTFAWKPCVVSAMVERSGGPVLWFDSATIFHGDIDSILDGVERDGVYTLAGQSPLERIADPRTLALLAPASDDRHAPYRAGGVIGLDSSRALVQELVRRWRDLALDPSCIAPDGADPRAHKFDQAILTALVLRTWREHGLEIGSDEVDISSTDPVRWLSTRNKVAAWMPWRADPLVRAFFTCRHSGDRLLLRVARSGLIRGSAESAEGLLQRILERRRQRRLSAVRVTSKAEVRGRSCHCPSDLAVHWLHSEALREACDVVADEDSNIAHPERLQATVRSLSAIASAVEAGDAIHVKSDRLSAFVRYVLPGIRQPFVLVTGDSDASPVRRHAHLLEDQRVRHWFAQNCDIAERHPRLTRVPIGIDNPVYTKLDKRLGFLAAMALGRIPFDRTLSRNGIGDQRRLQQARAGLRRTVDAKPLRVLCTFHRNSVLLANAAAIPDRREACDILGASPDCHFVDRRLSQDAYWRAHDDFAFELSPRGNGLDCFRTWECLCLDTIPIVKTSALDALYRQEDFPVVIVESYREVTADNLRRWRTALAGRFTDEMRRRLTADYWIAQITERRRAASYPPVCSR